MTGPARPVRLLLPVLLLGTAGCGGAAPVGSAADYRSTGGDTVAMGPAADEPAADYLARTAAPVAEPVGGLDAADRYAYVTLTERLPPAAVVRLLDATGTTAVRAVLHVPLADTQAAVRQVPVTADAADLRAAMARAADDAAAEAETAARWSGEPAARLAATSRAEAAALADGCACTLALLVRGDATALRAAPEVRAVEVSPPVPTPRLLVLRPLFPDVPAGSGG